MSTLDAVLEPDPGPGAAPGPAPRDYRLTGPEGARARARGLAGAEWYRAPIARSRLQAPSARSDRRAALDTLAWFVLLAATGAVTVVAWGTWWIALPALAAYGVLYGSVSDSRWHECGHATAFRTRWPNTVVYHLASFMVVREPVSWRWSHARHHSDTIVVGLDPEIAVPRPTPRWKLLGSMVGIPGNLAELRKYLVNAVGRTTAEEREYLPAHEVRPAIRAARVHLVLHLGVIVAAVVLRSPLPLLLVTLASFHGRWLLVVFGLTQHAGLAEDVLDHRANTRTVLMNPVARFLYWNMNYHVEHHMFPVVPFHALPALHREIAEHLPPPFPSITAAYRQEILPTLRRQRVDPTWYARRPIPAPHHAPGADGDLTAPAGRVGAPAPLAADRGDGWVDAGDAATLAHEDVRGLQVGERLVAVYRTADGRLAATDGRCTHGRVPLTEGIVVGSVVECPRHNGRFDVLTGRALAKPACVDLETLPVREVEGRIQVRVSGR
jgi:fatty acid desaturase/nitrite reductase/ring-hydroxylating ferredoxin subunit